MIHGIHLQPELEKAFTDLGFLEWTEIQKKSIPLIQEGKDVIGQSHTGSGKTVAFGFPILEKTLARQGVQALILVPTRELCEQVTTELRKFSKHKRIHVLAIYGGVSIHPQIDNIQHAEIIVGTPGRMLDHLERGTLSLKKIRMLVLDEADKMFEMGFIDDIKKIISQTPSDRQTMLFSATIPPQVHDIVKHYMKHPERIKVQEYIDKGKLMQQYYQIGSNDKFSLLVHLLKNRPHGLTIVFCATRNRIDMVSRNLYKQGIQSEKIHGGLTQNRRQAAIEMLHKRTADILVASDVAARGLDIKEVTYIINYDVPKNSKDYIHRIGRTARAGKEGHVVTLLAQQDHDNFRNVLSDRSLVIEEVKPPQFERVHFVAQASQYGGRGRPMQGHGYHRTGTGYHREHGSYQGRMHSSSERGERPRGEYSRGSSYSGSSHGAYRTTHQGSSYRSSEHRSNDRRNERPHYRSDRSRNHSSH